MSEKLEKDSAAAVEDDQNFCAIRGPGAQNAAVKPEQKKRNKKNITRTWVVPVLSMVALIIIVWGAFMLFNP